MNNNTCTIDLATVQRRLAAAGIATIAVEGCKGRSLPLV